MRMGTIYSKVDGMIHHKTDLPKTLYPFYSYEFSSGGSIGEDFKSFNTKFRNFIKKALPEGYEIHYWNRGHYYCSGVIKDPMNRFIYLSISDVRFFQNEWDKIIIDLIFINIFIFI